ncbi:hypothetical protein SUGI_0119100 [Cryptomeria japonica]|nr:hypothetical protein SUGI_0119100 [Cryptomeria japonica]
MMCGYTNTKYGDVVARLKITDESVFEIVGCECSPSGFCDEDNMKPLAFDKHVGNCSKRSPTTMSLWVAPPGGRSSVTGMNAASTIPPLTIPIGFVPIFRMRELGVNWRKKGPPVERLTGAAARCPTVRVAPSVSTWAMKSASSGNTTASTLKKS